MGKPASHAYRKGGFGSRPTFPTDDFHSEPEVGSPRSAQTFDQRTSRGGREAGGAPHPVSLPWARAHSLTFKQPPRVLLVQRQQLPGSLADLGQGELDPPHLTFVAEPILACEERGLAAGRASSAPRPSANARLDNPARPQTVHTSGGGRRDAHARTPAAMSTCAASPTRRPSPTWPGNRNPGHTTHRSASTLDLGVISRRASEGSRRFCGKPSSGPPACWPRMSACACAGRKPEPMRAAHGACAVPQRRRRLARTVRDAAKAGSPSATAPQSRPTTSDRLNILISCRKVLTPLQPTPWPESRAAHSPSPEPPRAEKEKPPRPGLAFIATPLPGYVSAHAASLHQSEEVVPSGKALGEDR